MVSVVVQAASAVIMAVNSVNFFIREQFKCHQLHRRRGPQAATGHDLPDQESGRQTVPVIHPQVTVFSFVSR